MACSLLGREREVLRDDFDGSRIERVIKPDEGVDIAVTHQSARLVVRIHPRFCARSGIAYRSGGRRLETQSNRPTAQELPARMDELGETIASLQQPVEAMQDHHDRFGSPKAAKAQIGETYFARPWRQKQRNFELFGLGQIDPHPSRFLSIVVAGHRYQRIAGRCQAHLNTFGVTSTLAFHQPPAALKRVPAETGNRPSPVELKRIALTRNRRRLDQ